MRTSVVILAACICIAACGKKSGPAPVVAAPAFVDSPFLYTLIDSVAFATDSATISSTTYPNDSGKQDIMIKAVKTTAGTGYTIIFYITNFTGASAYPIAPPSVSASYYINNVRHYASSGQVVIATDSNNVLTGTFNFVADTIKAINGSFNVAL